MTSRSNSLTALRESAAAIFNLPAEYFSNESTIPRDEIPEIQRLMGCGYDDEGNLTYKRIAPVMCLDGDTINVNKYFLSPYLFKVTNYIVDHVYFHRLNTFQIARTVLFGKTATHNTNRAVSRSVSQYLRTDIAAETTFGLIAWVCMMVRAIFKIDD